LAAGSTRSRSAEHRSHRRADDDLAGLDRVVEDDVRNSISTVIGASSPAVASTTTASSSAGISKT